MDLRVDSITMIRMGLWALDTIYHAAFNTTAKCTPLHAPKYALNYTPDCTRLYTPSLLDLHSQASSQDTAKYTPSTLPRTPPSTFPSAHLGMLSRMLPIALHATPPACLTERSQVSSQDTPMYTPSMLPSTPLSTSSSTLPGILPRTVSIALDGTFPACFTVCSQ